MPKVEITYDNNPYYVLVNGLTVYRTDDLIEVERQKASYEAMTICELIDHFTQLWNEQPIAWKLAPALVQSLRDELTVEALESEVE